MKKYTASAALSAVPIKAVRSATETCITPAEAKVLLSKNQNVRSLSPTVVERLAQIISSGDWRLTNDAIAFDTHGNLVNGQHRLAACVKANRQINVLVIHGVTQDEVESMDTGARRMSAHILSHEGYKYATNLPAVVRVIEAVERHRESGHFLTTFPISMPEVLRRVRSEPEIAEATTFICAFNKRNSPQSAMSALFYFAKKLDAAIAIDFVDRFHTGINLERGSPIAALRDACSNWYISKSSGRVRFPPTTSADFVMLWVPIVRAWNAHVTGKLITSNHSLAYRRTVEKVPTIEGA